MDQPNAVFQGRTARGLELISWWLSDLRKVAKDREGRALSHKDIRQYQRIVMALKEMIELMAGIDAMLKHRQFNEGKLSNAIHN
jgi:hypothetical protein